MHLDLFPILAQTINLDPGHVIDALISIVGFFLVMQLKDIKTTLKDIQQMFLEHDRKITRLETKAKFEE
jgi:hypothetical protein